MTRKTPPAYSDGVYMMSGQDRPSPRKLSSLFMKGSDGLPSSKNRTAMLAFFGKWGIYSDFFQRILLRELLFLKKSFNRSFPTPSVHAQVKS